MYRSETFEHTETFRGAPRTIPVEFTVNRNAQVGPFPPVVYFAGYGEGKRSTNLLLRATDDIGVPVIAAKMHFNVVPTTIADTREQALETAVRIAVPEFMREMSHRTPEDNVNVASNSLGSALIGLSLRETDGQYFGNIMSLNPLGLTKPEESEPTILQFLHRYVSAMLQTRPYERNALQAGMAVNWEILKDVFSETFLSQLRIAKALDIAPEYVSHSENGHRVEIVSGSSDTLFTTEEIRNRLQRQVPQETEDREIKTPQITTVHGLKHQDVATGRSLDVMKRILFASHNNIDYTAANFSFR